MAQHNKEKKTIHYRLALLDDQSHKQLFTIHFTKTTFFVMIISMVVMLCAVVFAITAYTPVRTFIPGYPDAHSKRAAIQNAITIDSLESVIYRWELYSENIKRVVEGKEPLKIDSLINANQPAKATDEEAAALLKQDSILREEVKKEEQFNISSDRGKRELPIEGVHFFTPLKGVVSQGYDALIHPYVDITAASGSVVKAVLDGTVVFAGWSEDTGHTIQIQHEGDIISIYKHNENLSKKVGDKVTAGTPIAHVGNSGDLSTGAHLHFELWHKGQAVDPTLYINF